jgi:hypothetical protein
VRLLSCGAIASYCLITKRDNNGWPLDIYYHPSSKKFFSCSSLHGDLGMCYQVFTFDLVGNCCFVSQSVVVNLVHGGANASRRADLLMYVFHVYI